MSTRPETVGIVGGGASGVLAAVHLLERSPAPVRVVIVEPRAELGRGVAYGTSDLGHLLNVRAGCMSAFPDQPDHFSGWAHRLSDTDGQAFLPRAWYGDYLRSVLGPVDHVRAGAVDVVAGGGRAMIMLDGGRSLGCDQVVLAPGSSPLRWPGGLGGPGRRWVEDPWIPGALAGIRTDEPVLLVGTGLTAVDVALSLGAAGHQQVVAASRHGLLPYVHPETPSFPPSIVTPTAPTARSLVDWARSTAAQVGDWRPVVDALRPYTNEVWAGLSDVERRRLLRHLQRRWEVLRHRMAPSVAARIAAMRESGHLVVAAGGISAARTTRGGIDVELADGVARFGTVVNCSGPPSDVRQTGHRLIRTLLHAGVVRPGPLSLGLDTEVDGSIPGSDRRLWVVGPLRRGRDWETTAVPDIRVQAAALPGAMWQVPAVAGA